MTTIFYRSDYQLVLMYGYNGVKERSFPLLLCQPMRISLFSGFFPLQGPALYVYNDAVFTSDDWKGITMLSDSVKEKDVMKVGRFGLGFKSVFHLTGKL